MHLKRLFLHGFKSFAEPTSVELGLGLSVFVGPNGSGKSNLSDALRWGLGETRLREVRGPRAEDLIFQGSKGRRAAHLAEVVLTFSDEEMRLGLPQTEVELTRRHFRSGDSEVRLNDRHYRLRDLNRLLLGTGMAPSGYAFIAQGQVEAVLQEGAERRRYMVEEAAGAAGYRQRKTDALLELAHADGELARVLDTLTIENERREPLSQEVARLDEWESLRREIHELEVAVEKKRLRDIIRQRNSLGERRERDEREIGRLRGEGERLKAFEAELWETRETARLALYEADEEISGVEMLLARHTQARESHGDRVSELGGRRARLEESLREARIRKERAKSEMATMEASLAAARETAKLFRARFGDRPPLVVPERLGSWRGELTERISSLKAEDETLRAEMTELGEALARIENEILRREKEGRDLVRTRERMGEERRQLSLRLDRVRETSELTWGTGRALRPGARAVLEAAKGGKLSGIIGPLGALVTFAPDMSAAVGAAMGGSFDNIVVESERDIEGAIAFLRQHRLGRATFLALDRVRAPQPPEGFSGEKAFLGLASDLVQWEPKMAPAVLLVLGRTLVARDLEAARDFSRRQALRNRWVTLDGDVLAPGGAITGGEAERQGPNPVVELQALEAKLKEVENGLATTVQELEAAAKAYENLRAERLAKEGDRRLHSARLEANAQMCRASLEDLETAGDLDAGGLSVWRSAEEDIVRLQERILGAQGTAADADGLTQGLEREMREVADALAEAGGRVEFGGQKAKDLETRAGALRETRTLLRRFGQAMQTLERSLGETRGSVEGKSTRLEDALERTGLELERLRSARDESSLKLRVELGAGEDTEGLTPPADAPEQIGRLRARFQDLGPVNPAARQEYERSLERVGTLEARREDVLSTKERLLALASEADMELERRYRATLQEVDGHFRRLFEELFQGGEAYLQATGEGVDILAAPPGKRMGNLELLSGGERTLVALAWLLSLSELNPSPFLLLDEVEASLDEENIRRFLRYLDRHRDRQFLLISHQRMTMEWADVLIGVTMQVPGVSRLVEIRLEGDQRGDLGVF